MFERVIMFQLHFRREVMPCMLSIVGRVAMTAMRCSPIVESCLSDSNLLLLLFLLSTTLVESGCSIDYFCDTLCSTHSH